MNRVPADLRTENYKKVLACFKNESVLTVQDISQKLSLSRQTVMKCIEYHLENKSIVSLGKGESTVVGGKKPELFALNNQVFFIVIALHHHELSMALTDLNYSVVEMWQSEIKRFENLDSVFATINEGYESICVNHSDNKVCGVAFCVPLGHQKNSDILTVATPYPYWPKSDIGRSLLDPLKEIFPTASEFHLVPDSLAAGMSIYISHQDSVGDQDVVAFYTSTGIGGAILSDNTVFESAKTNLSYSLGHIVVDPFFKEECSCGSRGCLEQFVGRKSARSRAAQNLDAYENSCLKEILIKDLTFKDIFEGSAKGDEYCQNESRAAAKYFAVAIRNILMVSGCTEYVFQGDYGYADDVFKETLIEIISKSRYISNQILERHGLGVHYDKSALELAEMNGMTYMLKKDYLNTPAKYIK